jgi:hypothetical protein
LVGHPVAKEAPMKCFWCQVILPLNPLTVISKAGVNIPLQPHSTPWRKRNHDSYTPELAVIHEGIRESKREKIRERNEP